MPAKTQSQLGVAGCALRTRLHAWLNHACKIVTHAGQHRQVKCMHLPDRVAALSQALWEGRRPTLYHDHDQVCTAPESRRPVRPALRSLCLQHARHWMLHLLCLRGQSCTHTRALTSKSCALHCSAACKHTACCRETPGVYAVTITRLAAEWCRTPGATFVC